MPSTDKYSEDEHEEVVSGIMECGRSLHTDVHTYTMWLCFGRLHTKLATMVTSGEVNMVWVVV